MAERPNIVVVEKRTALERYQRDASDELTHLRDDSPEMYRRIVGAHEEHMRSAEAALRLLSKRDLRTRRLQLPLDKDIDADLVITLGGDGTLLHTSSFVRSEIPVLGVNTNPQSSVGYFCGTDIHRFEEALHAALANKLEVFSLARMKVDLDDKVVTNRVLNEILFCNESPALSTRYIIRDGKNEEKHTSSGIWVGPAAGSTAAQHSAGGDILPIDSRHIQYVVRELYRPMSEELNLGNGLIEPGQSLEVQSRFNDGRLYPDGAAQAIPVALGATIRLSLSQENLTLLGLDLSRRFGERLSSAN